MFCENHFSRAVWRGAVVLVVVWLGLGYGLRGAAQPATPRLNLSTAAGATELPVGPWGSYSARHAGPCYLASRRLAPLFAFPIVVSQERDELLPIGSRATDGKVRLRPERVTILRRAAGLSPAGAAGDAAGRPPTARIVDADSYGYLTSARITFPEAALTQDVSKRRDAAGNPLAPAKWPASTAMVAWSAAFADNGAEGLVVRIALSNPGAAAQRFCVDLSGGLDRPDPLFAVSDFSIEADPEGRGLPFKHKKLETWLAITAQQGDYSTHFYGASEEVFAANASICPRDTSGAALLAPAAAAGPRAWALTRLSRITVEAGETRTIALSIGLGRDSEGALVSARTLLAAAEERKDGPPRVSLFAAAEKAHEAARYNSGSAALDGLMAQSLTNIPFHDLRRVGVVSRESTPYYQPGVGGWMALGWGVARPDWSAAQLNAWFLTQSPPQKVIRRAIAVPPTDIFVLWDLVQRTHNKDLAEKFYPYAVWRFREFLESGREREDDWLFTWPSQRPIGATQPGLSAAATRTPEYSPEYSAYVLLAARSLLACARTLEKSAEEQATFQHAIDNAYSAMSKELWDPARGRFLFKPVPSAEVATVADRPERSDGDRLESILPFVAGQEVLTPDQDAALRTHLGDTATYLSPFGLRSESANLMEVPAAVNRGRACQRISALHRGEVMEIAMR